MAGQWTICDLCGAVIANDTRHASWHYPPQFPPAPNADLTIYTETELDNG